ncbi:glycerophosphodiester phosphodiesterase family protein [Microbacterium sp. ZXX196]|uniref:glycerophosphodiester phosphodiesterase family protein n=1 Tax=Microbacterium sp. ZXX196 TaxID=2609291 RepID=UPI0012B9394E|nr:glycerophosphodiester phosphodiesterase family protein [Microbacterium sp. ZXX196]MTE24501.1 glycerophosphodiester phosphodiesterase [Microbacterium sp. ZXX196]
MAAPETLIIGHRGAPGYRPEHTRGSYELAIALGAGAIEPDVVATRDGVAIVRHENEISSTTDVADRPEFADRRTRKAFAGVEIDGWFAEDFTWDELRVLRCRERIPEIRPGSAAYDGRWPILSLREVLALAREAGVGIVVELKHEPYFRSIGIDLPALVAADLVAEGWQDEARLHGLVVESFEQSALDRVREEGIRAAFVYLVERSGTAVDLLLAGGEAPSYREQLARVEGIAGRADGISVHASLIAGPRRADPFLERARDAGLAVYAWTARPENAFLRRRNRSSADPAAHGDWRAEWEPLVAAGLDGIFADHPDLARAAFKPPKSTFLR